jgi:DNA-binding XRE family transcriptional regulator
LALDQGGVLKLDRDKVIRAREMLGYAIETVAEEAGVSKNSVLRAEHGEHIRPLTARKIAAALGVTVADLYEESETLKAGAPLEPSLFNGLEEEWRLRYLRAFRAFVHTLARCWREQPPKTSREIAPPFEALTAVVEQGVFEPAEGVSPAEAHELTLLTMGFQRLNEIANKVEQNEQRNAVVRDLRERFSA